MLERDGHPNVSRRWGWAIGIAAAALIPMQLVARTPAAAPQETAKLEEQIRAAQAVERAQAEIERAKESEAEARLAVQLEKKLTEASLLESEAKLTEKNREQLEIASAMARIAEKARAEAGQIDQANAKLAEVMAQIEKARQTQESGEARDRVETIRRLMTERVEQRQLEKVDGQIVSKLQNEEFARQIRQLADRLEELAREQRQLSERLRGLLERQASF